MHILMAGVPSDADGSALTSQLLAISGVNGVHDLHIWTMSAGKLNVWAHLSVDSTADRTQVLYQAQAAARALNCHHTCFQLEEPTYDRAVEGGDCFEPGQPPKLH
jgi:Co/Zn/Cd efflux system component